MKTISGLQYIIRDRACIWRVLFVFCCTLFFCACSDKKVDTTGVAARVGDRELRFEEVARNVPPGMSEADSTRIARLFITNWLEEQAVMLMAERQIPDTKEIDRMVEEYRRQLLMWEYRRQMTLKNGMPAPDNDEIDRYYDNHKGTLKLKRPIIKGIYIKLPDDAPEVPEIKKLYRSAKTQDLDKLENLMDRAVNYDYFRDKWVDWSQIEERIPSVELDADPDNFPVTHDHLEVTADGYVYLLDISDYMKAGETMPVDFARNYVIEALERENAVTYDKTLRKQLLDKAIHEGVANIYVDL